MKKYVCETPFDIPTPINTIKMEQKQDLIKIKGSESTSNGSNVNIINPDGELTNGQGIGAIMIRSGYEPPNLNKCGKGTSDWRRKKTTYFEKLSSTTLRNELNESPSSSGIFNSNSSKYAKQRNDFLLDDSVNEKSEVIQRSIIVPIKDDFPIKPRKCSPMKRSPPLIVKKAYQSDVSKLACDLIKPQLNELTSARAQFDQMEHNEKHAENVTSDHSIIHIKKKETITLSERETRTETFEPGMLAHSNVPINSLKKINEAQFLPQIHDGLQHVGINKIYRVQAYAWSHLLRNNSLFIVNPSKSGKTWSYLPALCNDTYYDVNDLDLTYGPVVIVLVASAKHVQIIADHCRRLLYGLTDEASAVVASFGQRNFIESKIKLLNSCGMLIATPASLLRLLNDDQSNLFNPERLKRIVIDDLDLILSRALDDFELALKALLTICKKTEATTLAAQVVVTSRSWNDWFIKLLRLSNQPLLLMGDFLEAAVYGKAKLSILLRAKLEKNKAIRCFLKKHNETLRASIRTVIICNDNDEVEGVMQYLEKYGYNGICYYNHSTEKDRLLINKWKYKISNQILVCTDAGLFDLQIRNAQYLIHYSMPPSWTQFTTRFSVLRESYDNLIANNFEKILDNVQHSKKVRSLIILDEDNNQQLPRLVRFMRMHNQNVHKNILAVVKSLLKERAEARIRHGIDLCSDILEFGECDEPRCDKRHGITSLDVVTEKEGIPMNGELRIHILQVFSPTHYAARLIEHRRPCSKEWSEVRCSRKAAAFAVRLNLYYCDPNNAVQHWPPNAGDICVYKYWNEYRRARILNVPALPKNEYVISDSLQLTLKLIDDGVVIKSVRTSETLFCPEEFKDFPYQAIDIRLMNIVPYDNERTWDLIATKQVQKWIMDDIKAKHVTHVSVNFALASTIWINNLVVMEKLETIDTYVQIINLKLALIANQFALQYKGDRKSVRDMASEQGLLKLCSSVLENGMECNSNENEISMNFNKLSFPENNKDNVRVERDGGGACGINEIKSNIQADDDDDDDGDTEHIKEQREKIVSARDAKREEDWQTFPSDNYKSGHKPEPVDKLLFLEDKQSHFKESWSELPLNELAKVEIGDESENGNWENVFVQLIDQTVTRKFNELLELINTYVENIIANCNDVHEKIYGTYGNEISERLYRFFLCDYACFVDVKSEDLYKDCFYETSGVIVNFTPYQAIHCNLTGIQSNSFTKRFYVTKSYLYAAAIQENSRKANKTLSYRNLPINSYAVLLYECSEEGDFKQASLFNKRLLEEGAAIADPETKQFLTMEIDFEEKGKNSQHEGAEDVVDKLLTFSELYKCIANSDELDIVNFLELPNQEKVFSEAPARVSKEVVKISEETRSVGEINTLPEKAKREDWEELTLSSQDNCSMPPLNALHKRPQTTWHQTNCIISLSIHAPDIKDYYLKVTSDQLYFAADIHGEEHILILHFMGIIQPKLVSHELRGLNVAVLLVKSVCMNWPRLLKDPTKFNWLTYNYNAINLGEIDRVESTSLSSAVQIAPDDVTDSDNDSEKDLFETYNSNGNCVDDTDPFSKFFS
uniref:RNA helicase n=1 Tax=Glossina austeni TaxID=7395 RepID=A0A1A9VMX4_GLOAU